MELRNYQRRVLKELEDYFKLARTHGNDAYRRALDDNFAGNFKVMDLGEALSVTRADLTVMIPSKIVALARVSGSIEHRATF